MSGGSCRETRELLAAFLDRELPPDRSHAIQDHLDGCDGCRGFSAMEGAFTRQMRARLGPCEPPAALMSGLKAAMDAVDSLRAEEAPGNASARPRAAARAFASPWIRRFAYAMAGGAFLLVLLMPLAREYNPGLYDQARMFFSRTQRQSATLVCVECEQEGTPLTMQRHCRAPGHQTGLRCPQTGLWHLVANEATLPLMRDRERRGETVIVEGRWLDDIHYVDARSVRLPGGI